MQYNGLLLDEFDQRSFYIYHLALHFGCVYTSLHFTAYVLNVAIWGWLVAISQKRCKIGPQSQWPTNRKSHTRFRLVPKSSTLDYPERPWTAKTHSVALWCRKDASFGAHCTNL